VNSQLSKEINFEILFRILEHVLFCKILQQKFCLCSAVIGQSAVCTNIDMKRQRCCLHLAFEVYFQCENCSLSKEKFRNFSFEINFQCERGLMQLLPVFKGIKFWGKWYNFDQVNEFSIPQGGQMCNYLCRISRSMNLLKLVQSWLSYWWHNWAIFSPQCRINNAKFSLDKHILPNRFQTLRKFIDSFQEHQINDTDY